MPLSEQDIAKARQHFPCFGHFDRAHCANLGFLQPKRDPRTGVMDMCKHCPLEPDCIKVTRAYLSNSDVYNAGKIDKPRVGLRILDNRGKVEVTQDDRKTLKELAEVGHASAVQNQPGFRENPLARALRKLREAEKAERAGQQR